MTRAQMAEREEARESLRKLLPVGSTVYGIVRDVSANGMSRVITFHVVDREGRIGDVTGLVARATSVGRIVEARSYRTSWGLRVEGCGMDMVHHVVQSLSYAIHGHGREDDSPAQVKARNGRLARGVELRERTDYTPGTRGPGYTLQARSL